MSLVRTTKKSTLQNRLNRPPSAEKQTEESNIPARRFCMFQTNMKKTVISPNRMAITTMTSSTAAAHSAGGLTYPNPKPKIARRSFSNQEFQFERHYPNISSPRYRKALKSSLCMMATNCRLANFLIIGLMIVVSESTEMLSSQQRYRELRSGALANGTLGRVNNFDVVANGASQVELCHVVSLNRHSVLDKEGKRIDFQISYPLEVVAALMLAFEHLNTGNGSVVEEVGGLNETCNIRFTAEFQDTSGREGAALENVISVLGRNASQSDEPLPCAFIGALSSSVTMATAALTGQMGYPQLGGVATSTKLDDKQPYPLFGRMLTAGNGFGPVALDYLYNHVGVRHLGVIYINNVVGLPFIDGVLSAAAMYPDLVVQPYSYAPEAVENDEEENAIPIAVKRLANTKFRYFLAIIDQHHYEEIMEQAFKEGIAGTGIHNWFTSNGGIAARLHNVEFEDNSPLHKASVGLTTISLAGSLPGVGVYDQFHAAWQALGQNNETLNYLQSLLPTYPDDPGYNPIMTSETFEDMTVFTPLLYDSAIAIGLAACGHGNISQLDGPTHYQDILKTAFVGASGTIALDPVTGTRTATSSPFTVTNVVAIKEGNVTQLVYNHIGQFADGKWNQTVPLTFNDWTTSFPLDLPELIVEENHIGAGLRLGGLLMSSVVVLCSFVCSAWTFSKRTGRIVKASQPFFLHLICIGTTLMGLAIIPLGIDGEVAEETGCSIACMTFPWLLSFGWVFVFSALFTKTHRVNKVFHMPRFSKVSVTISDVMKPMALLLAVHVIILSTMTAVSPFRWERTHLGDDEFGRADEFRGFCTSEDTFPFLLALLLVDLGTLVLAVYEAYVARNISLEFAESDSIARVLGCLFLVIFLGIPVLYIAEDDNRASYFVYAGIIFVVCMATLLLLFIPKMVFKEKESQLKSIRSSMTRSEDNFATSDSSDGAFVIDHPKLRESLVISNRKLKQRVEALEGIFSNCTDPLEVFEMYSALSGFKDGERNCSPSVAPMESAPLTHIDSLEDISESQQHVDKVVAHTLDSEATGKDKSAEDAESQCKQQEDGVLTPDQLPPSGPSLESSDSSEHAADLTAQSMSSGHVSEPCASLECAENGSESILVPETHNGEVVSETTISERASAEPLDAMPDDACHGAADKVAVGDSESVARDPSPPQAPEATVGAENSEAVARDPSSPQAPGAPNVSKEIPSVTGEPQHSAPQL